MLSFSTIIHYLNLCLWTYLTVPFPLCVTLSSAMQMFCSALRFLLRSDHSAESQNHMHLFRRLHQPLKGQWGRRVAEEWTRINCSTCISRQKKQFYSVLCARAGNGHQIWISWEIRRQVRTAVSYGTGKVFKKLEVRSLVYCHFKIHIRKYLIYFVPISTMKQRIHNKLI